MLALSHFLQHEFSITEGLRAHVHLVHHRHKEAAELAVGLFLVVERATSLEPAPGTTEDDHRELVVVVLVLLRDGRSELGL